MRNIALVLMYNGTAYHGWQVQKTEVSVAQTLERGLFDGLFMADVIGYYDVYQQGVDVTLRQGIQLPVNNPWLLVSAMATVTQHLGFGLTATVGAHHPYTFARDVSTLDQLTGGRVGWNIVTGYVDSGARGLGLDGLGAHDRRYDQADDFLTQCAGSPGVQPGVESADGAAVLRGACA